MTDAQRVRDRMEKFKEKWEIGGQKPQKNLKKIERWVCYHWPYASESFKKKQARTYKTDADASER